MMNIRARTQVRHFQQFADYHPIATSPLLRHLLHLSQLTVTCAQLRVPLPVPLKVEEDLARISIFQDPLALRALIIFATRL